MSTPISGKLNRDQMAWRVAQNIPGGSYVNLGIGMPEMVANHVPHLLVDWDVKQLRITPAQVKQQLAAGDPPILTARIHGTGSEGFLVSVFMLQPGEERVVAKRLTEILKRASR